MENKRVDLHMHSTYSDGSKTPKVLLEMAQNKNIVTMALTDHDNIDGSKELMHYRDNGIYLYSGVELTAKSPKGRMHILGYNIDLDNPVLNAKLKEVRTYSLYNIMLYIEVLKHDFGINLPTREVETMLKKEGNVGRPELARLLIRLGYCTEVEEAFQKYLIAACDRIRKLKKGLTSEECISLIKNAGGVASLAHPSSLKMTNQELDQEVKYLKDLGMESIEVIHINNTPEQRTYYMELARKYDLLISGGTDFHGLEVKPDVELGTGRHGNVDIREDTLSLTKNIRSRYMS